MARRSSVAETIMKNLRVLATDQRTTTDVDDQGKTVVKNISMVTIEATPSIAEKISVARALGDLSVVLRPLADSASELDAAIADGSVKVPDGKDPQGRKGHARRRLEPADRGQDDLRHRCRRVALPAPHRARQGRDRRTARQRRRRRNGYPGAVPANAGPTVRIARGNNVTEVPVGGKN